MSLIPVWAKALIVAGMVLAILAAVAAWRISLIEDGKTIERAGWVERDRQAAETSAKETQRRLERQGDSNRETATKLAAAGAAVRRERDSAGKLRDDLDAATAARRSADPAAAVVCAPAEADRDLHAGLFQRADDTAGELATIANARGIAGSQCEALYDALTGAKP
ncbi:MAG: BuPhKS9 gp43 [Variovorax sp.]|nr:BuPhKS9 gp43 [Variovorax sp.]